MARAVGDLVAELEAEAEEGLELKPSYNVAPTADVPIVLERLMDGALVRQLHVAKWGLVPSWAKDPSVGVRAFNARSETVAEKPTFRSAVKSKRCAVPVEGYYEWKKPSVGSQSKQKQPFYIHSQDGSLIMFAGLYEWWKDPAKQDGDPDHWLLSCSILTMASPATDSEDPVLAQLGELHDRLPIPMDAAMMADWLDPQGDGKSMVDALVAGAPAVAATWTLDAVGIAVGNVRNNTPDLVTPLV